MDKYLHIENVGMAFETRGRRFEALRDISLDVKRGEFVTLIGHSGCGKSTLLNLVAGLLHPTPAVGGEPWEAAEPLIPALEGLNRGWYAGPVGWMDAAEDGEFCVAIRSALLRDRTGHLFAGNGIVIDSEPEAELAETEVKVGALLPALAG